MEYQSPQDPIAMNSRYFKGRLLAPLPSKQQYVAVNSEDSYMILIGILHMFSNSILQSSNFGLISHNFFYSKPAIFLLKRTMTFPIFGPGAIATAADGFVDESVLWGYRLSFIDDCGADLAEIGKVRMLQGFYKQQKALLFEASKRIEQFEITIN